MNSITVRIADPKFIKARIMRHSTFVPADGACGDGGRVRDPDGLVIRVVDGAEGPKPGRGTVGSGGEAAESELEPGAGVPARGEA